MGTLRNEYETRRVRELGHKWTGRCGGLRAGGSCDSRKEHYPGPLHMGRMGPGQSVLLLAGRQFYQREARLSSAMQTLPQTPPDGWIGFTAGLADPRSISRSSVKLKKTGAAGVGYVCMMSESWLDPAVITSELIFEVMRREHLLSLR